MFGKFFLDREDRLLPSDDLMTIFDRLGWSKPDNPKKEFGFSDG